MKEIDEQDLSKKSNSMQVDDDRGHVVESVTGAQGTLSTNGGITDDAMRPAEDDCTRGHADPLVAVSDQTGNANDTDGDVDGEFVEPGDGDSAENEGQVNGNKKRRHRRGKQKGGTHHRKWKPYTKMTWEERRELDERETTRACKKREERFASGHPVAPYNTTQFLMDDHKRDLHIHNHRRDGENNVNMNTGQPEDDSSDHICHPLGQGSRSVDLDSSEEFYESPNDELEELFMEREFTETYENIHAERLHTMTKNELIREYMDLESKLENYERRSDPSRGGTGGSLNNNTVNHNKARVRPTDGSTDEIKTPSKLEKEMKLLREENERLRTENKLLNARRCQLNA